MIEEVIYPFSWKHFRAFPVARDRHFTTPERDGCDLLAEIIDDLVHGLAIGLEGWGQWPGPHRSKCLARVGNSCRGGVEHPRAAIVPRPRTGCGAGEPEKALEGRHFGKPRDGTAGRPHPTREASGPCQTEKKKRCRCVDPCSLFEELKFETERC